MRARSTLLALAAGLAVADASVVTLALPALLRELDTTVEGVAAVLGVYTVALALALAPAERLGRRIGPGRLGGLGFGLFAAASLAGGAANSLGVLLAARAVQGAGGAAALVAAFALLFGGGVDEVRGRRLWLAAAVLAGAAGPALGGALTQAFSWRAIFYFQAPIVAAAAGACLAERRRRGHRSQGPSAQASRRLAPWGQTTEASTPEGSDPSGFAAAPAAALALVSAALTAVLFLLVLLLVAGWNVSPIRAALAVIVLPAGALAGARIAGDARSRAAAGCALVGAGVLALAFLPDAHVLWTVLPQVAAGVGMGLALPALGGDLLPERDPRDAARLLTIRHAGIALALAVLAPVVSADLDDATQRARERGVALVLDARLPPQRKVTLAPDLLAGVEDQEPRAGLRKALARRRGDFSGPQGRVYDRLAQRADDTLVTAVGEAFRTAFLVTGALALLGAVAVLDRRRLRALAATGAVVVALPAGYLALHGALAPRAVELHDPCKDRDLPSTGGIAGVLEDRALQLLDLTACRLGSSREELVLALADPDDARRFEDRHGTNPRSATGLLGGLIGG